MRWGWRRLLIVPLLASVHACDCGSGDWGCSINWDPSCGPLASPCGIGGQCASDGGACPEGFRIDPTTSCDDGGGICCAPPLPACAELSGVCQASSDFCLQGTLDGDCGDAGVCCSPSPTDDDGSSDDGPQPLDALSEDAPDTAAIGSCNGAPCASGCSCVPFLPDAGSASSDGATLSQNAGGGMCVRPLADASADEGGLEDADAADAGASGESVDAEMSDVAEAGDAMTLADTPNAAGSCGVILCAAGCTCTSPGASACTCP